MAKLLMRGRLGTGQSARFCPESGYAWSVRPNITGPSGELALSISFAMYRGTSCVFAITRPFPTDEERLVADEHWPASDDYQSSK